MATGNQPRVWRGAAPISPAANALIRAAVLGAPAEKLLELAARGILEVGRADRAAIWLAGAHSTERWSGLALDACQETPVEAWKYLDGVQPFLGLLVHGREPVVVDCARWEWSGLVGALAGMRTAAWFPVRLPGRTVGLALAAYASAEGPSDGEALQGLVDVLALAVGSCCEEDGLELERRGIEARQQIERAVLAGAPVEQIWREIVRAIVDHLGADSAVLAREVQGALRVEATGGSGELASEVAQGRMAEAFQSAQRQGRPILLRLPTQSLRAIPPGNHRHHLRCLAIAPLQAGEQCTGLLLADFPRTCDSSRVLADLELYAHLASLAWAREASPRTLANERRFQSKLLQTEKMAALGQLVSGIAHELNNPLTSIMGYAQLLLSRRHHAERMADAEKIYREAERTSRLVKNLLLFARETRPERRPVQVNELVERTLALRSYELKLENIVVELDLAPDLPRTMADPHQLQQVFLNLLVNAEQAIQQARGSGHIWIRTRSAGPDRLALEVSDDGPGIPPEVISRIFDPFFTTKPPGVGTGLGLSIAYGIVQEHGGEISVHSEPEVGTTFVVEFPTLREEEVPVGDEMPGRIAAPPTRPGRRILVVEDEPTVAQLVADVLREQGHLVDSVTDSQEGLARLAAKSYDLVICDLRMPRLDGQGFFWALVHSGNPAQHRILFITGDTLAPRTQEFLSKHEIPHLTKPFLVEELTLAVNQLLELLPNGRSRDADAGTHTAAPQPAGSRKATRAL